MSDRISVRLDRVANALHQVHRFPNIKDLLAKQNYTEDELATGQRLLDTATKQVAAHKLAIGYRSGATSAVNVAHRAAVDPFQRLADLARGIFKKEPALRIALGLNRPMPRNIPDFLSAANILFTNAQNHTDIQPRVAYRGYTAEYFAAEFAPVTALISAHNEQQASLTALQNAARAQDAALAELNAWFDEFRTIAKIALRKQPDLQESLGIRIRSRRNKTGVAIPTPTVSVAAITPPATPDAPAA